MEQMSITTDGVQMDLAGPAELPGLLERINTAYFWGVEWEQAEKSACAAQIAAHYDPRARYLGFSLEPPQMEGLRLFTGERLRTRIGTLSVLGLEACRTMSLLDVYAPAVQQVLLQVNHRLMPICYVNGCILGECAHASLALMRYLSVSGLGSAQERLEEHLVKIHLRRDGKGGWTGFPYYYTLLVLSEMPGVLAVNERAYTAARCEKLLRRKAQPGAISERRVQLLQRVLAEAHP